jgi:hypothetical protein
VAFPRLARPRERELITSEQAKVKLRTLDLEDKR